MKAVVRSIQRIFGGADAAGVRAQQLIPPEEQLKHIEQNIQAITSYVPEDQEIVLRDHIHAGGVLTAVEIRADRIHLHNPETQQSRLVRLDDTLENYQSLDSSMREELARKISRLLPDLAISKRKIALDHTIQVLKTIARDEADSVRQIVAEELADLPNAPYDLVRDLAFDPSLHVACPIVEFSPLLRDEDLLDIISGSNIPGLIEAIARRDEVSESVGDAIVNSKQEIAIHHLLKNPSAHFSEQAISTIVNEAQEHEIWHESLIHRPELNRRTLARVKGFVSQHILATLEHEHGLSTSHKRDASVATRHRLNSWTAEQERQAELRAKQLYDAGRLNEAILSQAIGEANEPFVIAALAQLTRITPTIVKRILRSDSAGVITALAWEAGISMREAMELQMKIGRIHHTKMLRARGGSDYPLDEREMRLFLEIFTG